MKISGKTTYRYEGEIVVTEDQGYGQDYLQFPFEVPKGTGELRLHLNYCPLKVKGVSNLITLGLFDPAGFRGNAHRNPPDPQVTLSSDRATPGFIAGPIPPGKWLAQLAVQTVVADEQPCTYSLEIQVLPEITARPSGPRRYPLAPAALRPSAVRSTATPLSVRPPMTPKIIDGHPGWFRGELHSHTVHSDGSLTVPELLAQASRNRLDFLAITDHNTITGLSEVEATAPEGLLVIPGMEFTTFHGHALALGIHRWIDWRTGFNGWKMQEAAQATHEAGGLFIMAHPNDIGSPVCTGCKWEYEDFDYGSADAIEIWNGTWPGDEDSNPKTLHLWRTIQEKNKDLTATSGSDYHGSKDWGNGLPLTYIYARQLSVPALLKGIRRGRVLISSGPWLSLQVTDGIDGPPAGIGDTLHTHQRRVSVAAGWEHAPSGARLNLRSSQGILASQIVEECGEEHQPIETLPEDRLWLEMFAEDGTLLAITNPVKVCQE